ncbi:hypothetical protein FVA77_04480 [Phyllobacterium endophyticum]|nr:hypothetical protein [Phyllobacterium endophyticum]TXR50536.1 hypothetical protein FVA77_04480 [Phyllobacterium endophyticum]
MKLSLTGRKKHLEVKAPPMKLLAVAQNSFYINWLVEQLRCGGPSGGIDDDLGKAIQGPALRVEMLLQMRDTAHVIIMDVRGNHDFNFFHAIRVTQLIDMVLDEANCRSASMIS